VPSAVRNRLARLQIGGTAALKQGTTRNVFGRQIQPVVAQHHWFIFFYNYFFPLTKTVVQPKAKINDSW